MREMTAREIDHVAGGGGFRARPERLPPIPYCLPCRKIGVPRWLY